MRGCRQPSPNWPQGRFARARFTDHNQRRIAPTRMVVELVKIALSADVNALGPAWHRTHYCPAARESFVSGSLALERVRLFVFWKERVDQAGEVELDGMSQDLGICVVLPGRRLQFAFSVLLADAFLQCGEFCCGLGIGVPESSLLFLRQAPNIGRVAKVEEGTVTHLRV